MSNSSTSISSPKFIPPIEVEILSNQVLVPKFIFVVITMIKQQISTILIFTTENDFTKNYALLHCVSCYCLSTLELHDIYPLNDNGIGKLHTKFVHYPPSLSNNQSSEFSSLHQFFPSINYYYFHPLSSILKMFPSSSPSIGNWNIYSLSKSSFIHSLESRDKRIDSRDTAVTVTLR